MGRRLAWFLLVLLAVAAAPSTAAAAIDHAGYNRLADTVWAGHGDRCSGRAQVRLVDEIAGDDDILGYADGVWDGTCTYSVRRDLSAYEACVITVHERGHLAGYEPVGGVDAWHDKAGLMSTNPLDAFPDPRQATGRPPYAPCAGLVGLTITREMAEDAVSRRWAVRSLSCRPSLGRCVGTTLAGRHVRWTVRYDARWSVVARRGG
jgi:hypothetical protein